MSNQLIVEEIKKALGAHGAWKLRLKTAVTTGRSQVSPSDVKCDNLCEFGKWLYGPTIDANTRAGKPYQVVKRLHAEFHECASRVMALAVDGNKTEANNLLDGEYTEKSEKLARALNKWRGELVAADRAA